MRGCVETRVETTIYFIGLLWFSGSYSIKVVLTTSVTNFFFPFNSMNSPIPFSAYGCSGIIRMIDDVTRTWPGLATKTFFVVLFFM